jgi:hypothetical protein
VGELDRLAAGQHLHVYLPGRNEARRAANEGEHAAVRRERGLDGGVGQVRDLHPFGARRGGSRPLQQPPGQAGCGNDQRHNSRCDRDKASRRPRGRTNVRGCPDLPRESRLGLLLQLFESELDIGDALGPAFRILAQATGDNLVQFHRHAR